MNDIAIFGAGGYGRESACMLKHINAINPTWNFLGFFDDTLPVGFKNYEGVILGGIESLNNYPKKLAIIIAVATPSALKAISGRITNPNIWFPNIIYPDSYIADETTLTMGKGNIFSIRSIISCNVKIGDFNVFNGSTSIGHDSEIGSFNVILAGSNISGNVTMGDENFMGLKSSILQKLHIGNRTRIGAHCLITKDTVDDGLYVGIPGKLKE